MNAKAEWTSYAFVGLGANLPSAKGDPAQTLTSVLPALQALTDSPLLISSFYESQPKDCPPGSPRYINAVAGLLPRAGATPESLLAQLQHLEQEYGRVRSGIVNETRTLDLDLLYFSAETRNTTMLTLPHPRAHLRRFVLEPFIELTNGEFMLAGRPLVHWLDGNKDPALHLVLRVSASGFFQS